MSARDTTPDAKAVRSAIYRRMTPDERCQIAVDLSVMTREIALENIRRRHPSYDDHQLRMALFRMLLGDDLFHRVWPREALLAP